MPYKDPEKNRICKRRWKKNHPEKNREYYRKNYAIHREERNKRSLKYHYDHPEQIKKNFQKWMSSHREERKLYQRKNWLSHRKDSYLKRKYGISNLAYLKLLNEQNCQCAICGIPQIELKESLHVDHDHDTGIVRGLLCRRCNAMLGMADDSIERFQKAIEYLEGE